MSKELDLVSPGEVLLEEYLIPLNMSGNQLAIALHVASNRISQIIKGEREITPDTALRLGKYFNTTPEFWLNLQMHYNLEKELRNKKEVLLEITPLKKTAA